MQSPATLLDLGSPMAAPLHMSNHVSPQGGWAFMGAREWTALSTHLGRGGHSLGFVGRLFGSQCALPGVAACLWSLRTFLVV